MMPSTASRDEWALALARFANCLRADWDIPGIRSAIHGAKSLGSREDIAIALVELTKRDGLRTPMLLAQDGPHWHTGRTPNVRVTRAKCAVYGHEHEDAGTCRLCPVERFDPTDIPTLALSPAQVALNTRGARLVRDAIAGQAIHTPAAPDARSLAANDREDEDR